MSGTDDYAGWLGMRELDTAAGVPKGSAFRAFKALLSQLHEDVDFVVIDVQAAQALAARLIAAGRIYPVSVKPVLLAPAAAARVRALLGPAINR